MKLKNFYLLLTFFICASVFCSCSKKERAMDRLESFTEKLEQKSNNYSSSDWEEASTEFDEITDELTEYEYSDDERKLIGELKGRCMGKFAIAKAKGALDNLKNFGKELEGIAEGLMKSMDE